MDHHMVVVSKRFHESQIHYTVNNVGLSLSMTLDEFIRSLAKAAIIPEKVEGLVKKKSVPLLTQEQLLEMLSLASSYVTDEMKAASIHNPPPLQAG